MVLLELCFLVWGKDTSRQCLELKQPWRAQYLAERGIFASIKWSKIEVVQKRAGRYWDWLFSKALCVQLPKVAWVRPALLNKSNCLAQQLQESLSLWLWKGAHQLRLWRLTSRAHRDLGFATSLALFWNTAGLGWTILLLLLVLSLFILLFQVLRVVCSQTRKPLRSSHCWYSHWCLEEITEEPFPSPSSL